MPLDIVRLFGSTFHARSNDAEWRAGVTLWLKSYHQVPAGSLPKDDIELCRLAELGRDVKSWRKLKPMAMHGWYEARDDRLYHGTVAEKVNDAWRRKSEQRVRTLKARIAAMEKRLSEAATDGDRQHLQALLDGLQQSLSQTIPKSVTDRPTHPVAETKGQGHGQGQGHSKSSEEPDGSSGGKPPAGSDLTSRIFGEGRVWLEGVTGLGDAKCRSLLGNWRSKLGDAQLIEALGRAQREGVEHPESWFKALIKSRAGANGSGSQSNDPWAGVAV